METKNFDLILIGATGFTGRRAAAYLHDHAPEDLNWAIAARNPEKLKAVAQKTGRSDDQMFVADTLNRDEVDEVVSKARIILTTVGPFSLYGEHIIASCAAHGTHYLDITGEVGFIRDMKQKYGETAEKNGSILIPFSGFDSIPADVGASLIHNALPQSRSLQIRSFYSISGGFNGGTIATMLNKFESGEFRKMNDPHLLSIRDAEDSLVHISKDPLRNYFGYHSESGRWIAPFIMGSINSKIVYQSFKEKADGQVGAPEEVSYQEFSSLGPWYNPLPFLITTLILLCITKLGPYAWFRSLLRKVMPAPGEGPTEEQIENGYFKARFTGTDDKGHSASLLMSYPGDPGNKSTVFFLCESALRLQSMIQADESSLSAGFVTPVQLFGDELASHLKSKGLEISEI